MKKDRFFNTVIYLLISFFLLSCEKSNEPGSNDLYMIGYGTSFSNCTGYCKRDISFRQGELIFNRNGWNDTIKKVTCLDHLDDITWENLKNEINTHDFFKLPETIGCPDCADGGAEWIELTMNNGNSKKVVFEYDDEPMEVNGYIDLLRQKLVDYEFCDEEE